MPLFRKVSAPSPRARRRKSFILILPATIGVLGMVAFNVHAQEGAATTATAAKKALPTLVLSNEPCVNPVTTTRPVSDVFDPNYTLLKGMKAGDAFGIAVASGDIDGDGYTDLVVGARGEVPKGNSLGTVYIYRGSAKGVSTTPTWVLTGEQANAEFGRTLTVGDFNGDGYADVLVGAHGFNGGLGAHQGKIYLYLGGPKGLGKTPVQTIVGEHKGDEFGRDFDVVDMNRDGIVDLLVGASGYNGDIEAQGKVYVYKGTKKGLDAKPIFTAVGEGAHDEFGRSISGADVNGDGFPDVIVGATGLTGAGKGAGAKVPGFMYVYYGSAKGFSPTPGFKVSGVRTGGHLGEGMSAVGDMNGDGFPDVAIGERDFSCEGRDAGRIDVYLGGPEGLSKDRVWSAVGKGKGGVGRSVAPVGDLNGDGYDDFITGAPVGTAEDGAGLYVFFGGPKGFGGDPILISPEGVASGIGFGLFTARGVKGNNAPAIAVGAPTGGDAKEGWVRVYYGKLTSGKSSTLPAKKK